MKPMSILFVYITIILNHLILLFFDNCIIITVIISIISGNVYMNHMYPFGGAAVKLCLFQLDTTIIREEEMAKDGRKGYGMLLGVLAVGRR